MKSRWPRRPLFAFCVLSSFVLLTSAPVAAQAGAKSARIVRCPIKVESPLLVKTELTDPLGLAMTIRDGQDALSRYLRTQMSPETQLLLHNIRDGSLPPDLPYALVRDRNRLSRGPSLFTRARFAGV